MLGGRGWEDGEVSVWLKAAEDDCPWWPRAAQGCGAAGEVAVWIDAGVGALTSRGKAIAGRMEGGRRAEGFSRSARGPAARGEEPISRRFSCLLRGTRSAASKALAGPGVGSWVRAPGVLGKKKGW